MNYGERLKYLREEAGLTQKELASLININKDAYSKYEREALIIPLKHLNSLCEYFKCSFDYIFGFNNEFNYSETKELDKYKAGTRLKEFRKNNKITQERLAHTLNTTHSVISDYESGRYLIATPFLYMICNKYHISADYLLGKTDTLNILITN